MRKNFIILFILFAQIGFAQQSKEKAVFSSAAAEEMFIHYNAPLLLPGESLYYKVYNLIKDSHRESEISKVANVKLLNSDGDEIFHHKLNLENGTSYSDYLIPADLASGIYTLLGYTNWMKNYDLKGAFESQILIINPYLKNSEKNIRISDNPNDAPKKSQNSSADQQLEMKLNKSSFGKREKVTVSFTGDNEILEDAQFSISVRKDDKFIDLTTPSSTNFKTGEIEPFKMQILPEMRGRIISGRVERNNDNKNNRKLSIGFYVPNAPEKFRVFETSEDGSFKVSIEEPIAYEKAYLKVTEDLDTGYRISIDSSSLDYKLQDPQTIVIPASAKSDLEQRAVYNQIQQSYLAVRSDSVSRTSKEGDFFGNKAMVYNLDDYTRFSTMAEVFVEIIQFASFKKEEDVYVPEISGYNSQTDFGNKPLLLIDGAMITDYNYFYYMDAKLIEKISIVRDKYFYGPQIYQGIIIVETVKEDIPNFKADYTLDIIPTETAKYYYSPDYSSEASIAELARIPDYRSQLFWQPEVGNKEINFFTSDLTGTFRIQIEGFQKNGKSISLEKTFEVKE